MHNAKHQQPAPAPTPKAASLAAAGYLPARNLPTYAVAQWRRAEAENDNSRVERKVASR